VAKYIGPQQVSPADVRMQSTLCSVRPRVGFGRYNWCQDCNKRYYDQENTRGENEFVMRQRPPHGCPASGHSTGIAHHSMLFRPGTKCRLQPNPPRSEITGAHHRARHAHPLSLLAARTTYRGQTLRFVYVHWIRVWEEYGLHYANIGRVTTPSSHDRSVAKGIIVSIFSSWHLKFKQWQEDRTLPPDRRPVRSLHGEFADDSRDTAISPLGAPAPYMHEDAEHGGTGDLAGFEKGAGEVLGDEERIND
jgi:hypothetical protein